VVKAAHTIAKKRLFVILVRMNFESTKRLLVPSTIVEVWSMRIKNQHMLRHVPTNYDGFTRKNQQSIDYKQVKKRYFKVDILVDIFNPERSYTMIFEFFCVTLFGLFFGSAVAFAGYSMFRSILPVFGFLYGFVLGAQAVQLLFGIGFLSAMTSWIVGLIVGIVFAILSYRFFRFAIALAAGSLAYGLGVTFLLWIGLRAGFIIWTAGMILAAVGIYATYKFRLEKYVIVFNTSIMGAAVIVNILMSTGGEVALSQVAENPIREMLQGSPLWTIFYLVIVAAGAFVQMKTPKMLYWNQPRITEGLPEYDNVNFRVPPL
jgi:hypothetical protein